MPDPAGSRSVLVRLIRGVRRGALATVYRLTQRLAPPALNRKVAFTVNAPIEPNFLIGTLSGLLFYHEGQLYRLFDGRVYGITRCGSRWYIYRNQDPLFGKGWGPERGQIISFRLDQARAVDVRAELGLLDPEVHQIDCHDDRLLITDTGNNALLVYEVSPDGLQPAGCHYPNGPLRPGRKEVNYVHINSVFFNGSNYYLVYHNQTYKTGRNSEIVELDRHFALQRRWSTRAKSAHNIYVDGDDYWICNSQDGELVVNDEPLLEIPYYTRGLALNDELLLLGASEFANKAQRMHKDGHVFALRRDKLDIQAKLSMPGSGSVYELRLVDQPDYGLSQVFTARRAGRQPMV